MEVITLNIILDVECCAAYEKVVPIIRKIKIISRKEVSELTTSGWICQADSLRSIVTTISIVPVRIAKDKSLQQRFVDFKPYLLRCRLRAVSVVKVDNTDAVVCIVDGGHIDIHISRGVSLPGQQDLSLLRRQVGDHDHNLE